MLPDFRSDVLRSSSHDAGGVFRNTLDRRILNQRLIGGILAATLLAALFYQHNPFEQLALTAMAVLMGALLAALTFTRLPLLPVQVTGLLGGWAYLLAKTAYVLFALPGDAGLPMLMGLAPWGAVLLAAHLWILGARRSALLNAAALGSMGALLLIKLVLTPAAAHSSVTGTLLQMLLASAVLLFGQRHAAQRLRADARRAVLGQDTAGLDALTGLPDRVTLERQLEGLFQQDPEQLVVAAIGVDTPGGQPADATFQPRLAAHVSRVLMGTVRDQDLLGCLGDGVAALVMRAPDARSARAACERLRVRVASRPLDGVNPTVTIGVVYADGHLDALALLRAAEDTLSAARRSGTNRVLLGPVTTGAAHEEAELLPPQALPA